MKYKRVNENFCCCCCYFFLLWVRLIYVKARSICLRCCFFLFCCCCFALFETVWSGCVFKQKVSHFYNNISSRIQIIQFFLCWCAREREYECAFICFRFFFALSSALPFKVYICDYWLSIGLESVLLECLHTAALLYAIFLLHSVFHLKLRFIIQSVRYSSDNRFDSSVSH